MGWRERLQPASFRDVPFQVEGSDDRVGRRGQTTEYPGRDTPYHEDLGRAARRYSLDAFLIGDDYLEQRDRLLTAIEAAGPGTLVHPWFGSLQVDLDGEVRVGHRWDDGGVCVISLNFVEHGEQRYPTRGRDTASALLGQADALQVAAEAAFADAFETEGFPDYVGEQSVTAASGLLDTVTGALSRLNGELLAPLDALRSNVSSWLGPASELGKFSAGVSGVWSQLQDLSQKPLQLQAQIRSMLSLAQSSALRPLGLWVSLSDAARRVLGNRNAVAALVRQTAAAEVLRLVATIPVQVPVKPLSRPAVDDGDQSLPTLLTGHADLLALRDQLGNAFDQEALRADSDGLFRALELARLAAHADLSERASKAPRLITLTPPEVLPAVVLAARWQDDAGRADELVARNGIKHPGFVPVQALQVVPS